MLKGKKTLFFRLYCNLFSLSAHLTYECSVLLVQYEEVIGCWQQVILRHRGCGLNNYYETV